MLRLAFLLTLLPTIALADIIGSARVIDGDTIEVAGQRIRLHGIDAPESKQTCEREGVTWLCGAAASAKLRELVGTGQVRCLGSGQDRYGRLIAVCLNGEININATMVATGLALAYRHYSKDYVAQETAAQVARWGLWAGRFVEPWDWRRGKRLANAAANKNVAGACQIKGNISSKGTRIYHIPGGRWYDRTKIDQAKGERWFCTEAEAKSAGWRAAGQPAYTAPRSSTAQPPAATSPPRSCCKVCRKGQACGNSCISRRYTCRKLPGCACDG